MISGRRGRRKFLAGLGAALFAATPFDGRPAFSQTVRPGRVSARGFARLGPNLAITVGTLDDTPSTARVHAAIVRALESAGHRVDSVETNWRLTFATEIRLPLPVERRAAGSAPPAGDRATPSEMGHDQLPDRPYRPDRRPRAGSSDNRLRHVVNMTLAESTTGRVRWQGHVRYEAVEADPTGILVRIVPVLLADFGKTVAERRFTLD